MMNIQPASVVRILSRVPGETVREPNLYARRYGRRSSIPMRTRVLTWREVVLLVDGSIVTRTV